jgi:hypothetical protein
MRTGASESRQNNDFIKGLMNELPVTLIATAIGGPRLKLLGEGLPQRDRAFAQTARRFQAATLAPFAQTQPEDQEEWRNVLASFEFQLRLERMPRGALYDGLSDYVFERTGGYMSSVAALIRDGAARAIERGVERLDEDLLDDVRLDSAAEHYEDTPSDVYAS